MAHLIRTDALIPAAPEAVWAVLADFARYREWNPLNLEAHGEAVLGAKIPMVFRNLGSAKPGATISQTVTLVACEPGKALAWAGSVPLLFRGRHHFTLSPEGGGTRLLHGEDLRGLIPMTFSKAQIARDFVPAYEAVNAALAARVAALG
ncbi:SRPBCC domain-containing protein [Phenylobacterium sp.]|uniref:SRPBCC domain-containing protein n=1 Tax=Phenylobacterium sp. TaxID=1871053 RepID=UPI002724F90A|nr:SRPBCC domain-containing protein [Phenylobacterium sp.]MDO8377430.1 SRPBCC domain-containing protein [Phenylobacterium sp.]